MMTAPLADGFGRAFEYLRLSVTDACNFRCLYCLPDGYRAEEAEPPLTVAEVGRLARAFGSMGFWKVRLTGGEPTVRRDIVELAAAVASAPGVRRVALSTNGYRLVELASDLKSAGVRAVNVSVDSIDRARFEQITGHDRLAAVLAGIDRCLSLGYESVKANVVLLRELNDGELESFLVWVKDLPVEVRFIELMPTATNEAFFKRRHVAAAGLIQRLGALGWTETPRAPGAGPARSFRGPGYRGGVGVIAPYSKDFCSSCNRLRVSSRGGLRLCLFAEGDASLRPLLSSDAQEEALRERVRELLARKEASHYLPEGRFGGLRHFAMTGG